ncbi:unnamed protein product [Pseudo-nitzschia multistriata]|uniref:Uncharacterized protein n=1 Tax=Pseudo-nitzschia multistriata TaxID=183589 RepID=A0A448ZC57_9STRA|nr:unnamed protein product [Pseudo-nitzschia multistriata]
MLFKALAVLSALPAFLVPGCLASWDEESSVITNNVQWKDRAGEKVKAGRGSTISEKIDGYWYMVGANSKPEIPKCNDLGGDIYIYRSKNLGSNSWEEVAKIEGKDARSCAMNKHPSGKIYLHCRRLICISEAKDGPEGPYKCDDELDVPNFHPKSDGNTRKVGGSSTFRKGNTGDLYFVTSRAERKKGGNRFAFIYKLSSDWKSIDREAASWEYNGRESPYVVEDNNKFYVFTSRTARWKYSRTHYKKADSLKGLETAKEFYVDMWPPDNPKIQSMGTQFTYIQKFGDGKWMFGGRRHPEEDPCNFGEKWGSLVMTPFEFKGGTPTVYWRNSFDWLGEASITSTYDNHPRDSYQPDCFNNPALFEMPWGQMKGCPWVQRKKTDIRCAKPGVTSECPVTCDAKFCDPDFCDPEKWKQKPNCP